MEGEVEDARPGGVRFAPDEDFAVVAGGGEDVAVFGVCPGDAPDGAFVAGGVLEGLEKRGGRAQGAGGKGNEGRRRGERK